MTSDSLQSAFTEITGFRQNPYHPFVWINGEPEIGEGTTIGFFSEVNAKMATLRIGANCDIASFVSINCADSHERCLGRSDHIHRRDITIGDHVFIGSHSVIKAGARIGHHSVVAAGTIVGPIEVPPYSLVIGNPAVVKEHRFLPRDREVA